MGRLGFWVEPSVVKFDEPISLPGMPCLEHGKAVPPLYFDNSSDGDHCGSTLVYKHERESERALSLSLYWQKSRFTFSTFILFALNFLINSSRIQNDDIAPNHRVLQYYKYLIPQFVFDEKPLQMLYSGGQL